MTEADERVESAAKCLLLRSETVSCCYQVAVGVQQRYQLCSPGVLLANILLKDFNEQGSSTTVNLLGAPGQRWGRTAIAGGGALGSPMHTTSNKLATREKRARFTNERAREIFWSRFGV